MVMKRVNTATLIRGDVYTLRHPDFGKNPNAVNIKFEYGKPVVVDDPKILDLLENTYDVVEDHDGEVYEKPRFRVERNVTRDLEGSAPAKPKRLSADRAVKLRRRNSA